jgi:hypothetical protein
MDTTYLVIIITTVVILITVILAIVLLAAVRKVNKGNSVIKLKESEIEWKELKCPKCQKVMDSGLSLAGHGIIWREKTEMTPGIFSNIGSVLENTISLNVLPALNISWRCSSCELVILDNSKMVKIKNS